MAAADYYNTVQQAYIAYYGRPADPEGLKYWAGELDTAGGDLNAIINAFANSEEYNGYLGSIENLRDRLDAIYVNSFGRPGEDAGLDYWEEQVSTGAKTEAEAALAILQGAQGPDLTVLNNKLTVAEFFTDTVDDNELVYGASDTAAARGLMASVDATSDSAAAAAAAATQWAISKGAPIDLSQDTKFSVDQYTNGQGETIDAIRLTGDQSVRVDMTDPTDPIQRVDLDSDGTIEINGYENQDGLTAMLWDGVTEPEGGDFEILDAYSRNPLNQTDATQNFLGNIYFDGTGFGGDGTATDGNIVLGGLGADILLGGIGNDFLAGGGVASNQAVQNTTRDILEGGRNADFFFVELSRLDPSDSPSNLDGGETADNTQADNAVSNQDSDWLLLEASDDDEPVFVNMGGSTAASPRSEKGYIRGDSDMDTDSGNTRAGWADMDEIENLDASGNLYGFLDDIDVKIGGLAGDSHVVGTSNQGLGSSAQLRVDGSAERNIIIGGYDNDEISGNGGNDLLMGGNLAYMGANPNIANISNDGIDILMGGAGDDDLVYELDGGTYSGGDGNDTLWLTDRMFGTGAATDTAMVFDLTSGAFGDFENVVATGMNLKADFNSGVDYLAAGGNFSSTDNNPDLPFDNVQNTMGSGEQSYRLSGTDTGNALYASDGQDVLEGRGGDDRLSGGSGADDFVFFAGGNDGLDTIHRQYDTDGDNIMARYGRDFGIDDGADASDSRLRIDIADNSNPTAALGDIATVIRVKTAIVTDEGNIEVLVEGEAIEAAKTYEELRDAVAAALAASENADVAALEVTLDGKVVILEDPQGRELLDGTHADTQLVFSTQGNASVDASMVFGLPTETYSLDRLMYAAYENRADYELRDDQGYVDETGDATSLGNDAYAEDLVYSFDNGNTTLTENQKWQVKFDNLADEDIVTISINGAEYSLQMGVLQDGSPIEEDVEAFVARFATYITNSDNSTTAGDLTATAANAAKIGDAGVNKGSITFSQSAVTGLGLGEAIYMEKPVVTVNSNGSNGVKGDVFVSAERSDHRVLIVGFDGRNGELKGTAGNIDDETVSSNIFFYGDTGENRSILATALDAGDTLTGLDAILADTLKDTDTVANDFALHGDDLLITGAGKDVVSGGTGDDRIFGSWGADEVDGGKDLFRVFLQNQTEPLVETMNLAEAIARLNTNGVARIETVALDDPDNVVTTVTAGTASLNGRGFYDELVFEQPDFGAGTSFYVTLDADIAQLDGGKGTVAATLDTRTETTSFEEIEQVRVASGNNTLTGQGNDSLSFEALSDAAKGSATANTNSSNAAGVDFTMLTGEVGVRSERDGNSSTAEPSLFFTSVVGVENVYGGDGDDSVTISSTEIGKNNIIDLDDETAEVGAPVGDKVTYDYAGYTAPNGDLLTAPVTTVTIEAGDETDSVEMVGYWDGPAGARLTATDTLIDVETLGFNANSINGLEDVLNVANTTDAVVNYGATIALGASEYENGLTSGTDDLTMLQAGGISDEGHLGREVAIVDNMAGLERVVAGGGNDRVIVADAMSTAGGVGQNVGNYGDSYLDYATITEVAGGFANDGNSRVLGDDSIGLGRVNLHQFDLGDGTDTLDYRNETGDVAVQVGTATGSDSQDAIIIDGSGNGSLNDGNDRVDLAIGVETYIGGRTASDNTIDLSTNTGDLTVDFSVIDATDETDSYRIEDPNGISSASGTRGTWTRTDVKSGTDVLASFLQDTNVTDTYWNQVFGGSGNETVLLNDTESKVATTMNLGTGDNVVSYAKLDNNSAYTGTTVEPTTSGITLNVEKSLETDPGTGSGRVDSTFTVANGTTTDSIHFTRGSGGDLTQGTLKVIGSSETDTVSIAALVGFNGVTESYHLVDLSKGVVTEDVLDNKTSQPVDQGGDNTDSVGNLSTQISGFENIIGSGVVDHLIGNSGANSIIAGDGADIVTGAGGFDTINLTDTDNANDRVVYTLGGVAEDDRGTGDIEGDTVTGFRSGEDEIVIEVDDSFAIDSFVVTGGGAPTTVGEFQIGDVDGDGDANDFFLLLADENGGGFDNNIQDDAVFILDVGAVATDVVVNVAMSQGQNSTELGLGAGPQVELVYTNQNQSTLGLRDVHNNFNMQTDTLDFTGFNFEVTDVDALPGNTGADGIQIDEVLTVVQSTSVSGASFAADFFSVTRDLDGDANDGLETIDVLFRLESEAGTSSWTLFVDVNRDGDFDQATDMVVDLTNVDFNGDGAVDALDIPASVEDIYDALDGTAGDGLTAGNGFASAYADLFAF